MLRIDKPNVRVSGAIPIVPKGEKASRSFMLPRGYVGDIFIQLETPTLSAADLPDGASVGVAAIIAENKRAAHGGGCQTIGLLTVTGENGRGAMAQTVEVRLRPAASLVRLVLARVGITRPLGEIRYRVSFAR